MTGRRICIVMLLQAAALGALAPSCPAGEPLRFAPCGYGGGGRFTVLAADPFDPLTVLAGSDVAGVFKSSDGGESFAPAGRGLEGFCVAAIAFHPDEPRTVFLLADDGLYQSRDGAATWKKVRADVSYRQRFSGSRLLVFFEHALWAGTDGSGVFRLPLEGFSSPVSPVPGLGIAKANSLAVCNAKLYVATSRGVFRLESSRWKSLSKGLPPGAADMTDMAADSAGRLYAVEKGSGLYLLDEAADAWHAVPADYEGGRPASFKTLAAHPAEPGRLFLGSHPEKWPFYLFESRSGGGLWKKCRGFSLSGNSPLKCAPPDAVESVLISAGPPGRMFVADWWNLWRSTDGGAGFSQLTRGNQNFVVNDIKQHPSEPDTLFMAVADTGLVRSVDGGKTWSRSMAGVEDGSGIEIEFSLRDSRIMYLLMQPWKPQERVLVYRTSDGGNTWSDIGFSIAGRKRPDLPFVDGLPTNLEIDPASDVTVYVGTNGYGVFKTTDGGAHWTAVNSGLSDPNIKGPDALLADPRRPGSLLASTQEGGIYTTADGGESWKKATPGARFTFGMARDPSNTAHVIAGCAEKTLLESWDGGATWTERKLPGEAPAHISAYSVAFDPASPKRVFAGTLAYDLRAADGLYESRDGGTHFTAVPLDLPRLNINDIAVTGGGPHRVLLGFNGIGLYGADLK